MSVSKKPLDILMQINDAIENSVLDDKDEDENEIDLYDKFIQHCESGELNEAAGILEEGLTTEVFDFDEIIEFSKAVYKKNEENTDEEYNLNEELKSFMEGTPIDAFAYEAFGENFNLISNFVIKEIKNEAVELARLDERNRIMANLSHTVKNMLGTIIDPLENMRGQKEVQPATIDNAIRGANLIRNLVNAMNLSFSGCEEDFIYDITEASYENSTSIKQMFIEALKYSISSMFDGKYFEKFMRNYFSDKAAYLKAKSAWIEISQTTELAKLVTFLEKYMLKVNLDIEQASEYILGDDKGSALKMLILIQEVVFNAVKYSSFVPRESRRLDISFEVNETVLIKVENSYKENVQVKTTGLGQEIVKNFSKLLKTEPKITQDSGNYKIEIEFKNYWRVTK